MPRLRTVSRWLLLMLALFVAVGAIPVGLMFLVRPDGALVGMPLSVLDGTPFRDFTVPGLLLTAAVGGSSLVAAVLLVARPRAGARAGLAAGAILTGWIVIQVALVGLISALQPAFLAIGLLELALGAVRVRAG